MCACWFCVMSDHFVACGYAEPGLKRVTGAPSVVYDDFLLDPGGIA